MAEKKWKAVDRGGDRWCVQAEGDFWPQLGFVYLTKGKADAVVEFANWLERKENLDKQPGEEKPVDGWEASMGDQSGIIAKIKTVDPDVLRDLSLGDGTYEVQTLASSKEFKAALDRGDQLVYARRQLGGLWDYIVEKFPPDVSVKDPSDPIRQVRVKPLLEDADELVGRLADAATMAAMTSTRTVTVAHSEVVKMVQLALRLQKALSG